MTISSRNLLKVYGDEGRRAHVGCIVAAIFGECIPDLACFAQDAKPAGSLLAAVRFDWPGEPPVGWVEELSRRMPGETFELYSDPAPAGWAPGCRVIIRGGRFLDGVGSGDTGGLNRNLPLSDSPLKEPALAAQGPLDLVAITIATIDRFYGYIYDDIIFPLYWKQRIEMNFVESQSCLLEALLTPDEASIVAPHRELHEERSNKSADCQRAAEYLQRAIQELASPHVTCRLNEADRLAVEQMRRLSVSLGWRGGSTQSGRLSEEAAATS